MSDNTIIHSVELDKINRVEAIAKRWFNGENTYHSVSVLAMVSTEYAESLGITSGVAVAPDGYTWVQLGYNPFSYGYERHYEHTAYSVLKEAAKGNYHDLDNVNVGSIYTACQMLGIAYSDDCQDVKRKKDL